MVQLRRRWVVADGLTLSRAQSLIRLGWAVAELRGRAWFQESDPGRMSAPMPRRADRSLPLGDERSAEEQLIESVRLTPVLADDAELSFDGVGTAILDGQKHPAVQPCSMADRVAQLAAALPADKHEPAWAATWSAFTEAIYEWDARIQDTLAGGIYGESAAYQLGRGLAECTWALDPSSGNEVSSWAFLLSGERCITLSGLVQRLAGVLEDPLIVRAIQGSLRTWSQVATDEQWRAGGAPIMLRKQALLWRDLLLGGVKPQSLVKPLSIANTVKTIRPLVRSVWLQLSGAFASVAMLSVGAWLLSKGHGVPGPLGQLVAGLGAFGLSGSALSARAKTATNQLPGKVREAVDADLVVEDATIAPRAPTHRLRADNVPGRLAPPGSSAEPLSINDVAAEIDKARNLAQIRRASQPAQ